MSIRVTPYLIFVGTPQPLAVAQGEDRRFVFTFVDPVNGKAIDFTGITAARMAVRDKSGALVFSRNYTPSASAPASGVLAFDVGQADTQTQLVAIYDCDVTWNDALGAKAQLLAPSAFEIVQGVGQPGDPVTTPPAVPVVYGLRWLGAWSALTTYLVNDAVTYPDPNGGTDNALSSFRCLIANTNVPPVSNLGALSPDWAYVAERGASAALAPYVPKNPGDYSTPPATIAAAADALARRTWQNDPAMAPAPLSEKPILDFSRGPLAPPQDFPRNLAGLQAYFPGASAMFSYQCQDAGPNLAETGGGTGFTGSGTPHFGLKTPFAPNKFAVALEDNASYFTATASDAFDPVGGSFNALFVFRAEILRTQNQCMLLQKGGAYSIYLWTNDNNQIVVDASDGAGHPIELFSAQGGFSRGAYGTGAYHTLLVSWDAVANTLTIRTEEESTSAALPGGWSWAGFTSAAAAILGNNAGHTAGLNGCVAYACSFQGVVTDDQFTKFVNYATTKGLPITWTPGAPSDGAGLSTIDLRDPTNPREPRFGRVQLPLDARSGRLGILGSGSGRYNFLLASEALDQAPWTTNGAGLTVAGRDAPDVSYGYSATKLSKLAAGPTPSRSQVVVMSFQNGPYVWGAWLHTVDGAPHLATIKMTLTGDGAQVITQDVMVTGTPQLFYVATGPFSSNSTTVTVEVFPTQASNNAQTGTIHVHNARLNASTAIPAPYSPTAGLKTSGISGALTTGGTVGVRDGFFELGLYYLDDLVAGTIVQTAQVSPQQGSVSLVANPALRSLIPTVQDPSGAIVQNLNQWDLSKVAVRGKRTHVSVSWDGNLNKSSMAVNGARAEGSSFQPSGDFTRIPRFNSQVTLFPTGQDVVLERFAAGSVGGLLSVGQQRQLAEQHLRRSVRRILCGIDSITEFYDGWHTALMRAIGVDKCVCVSAGISGDRVADNPYPASWLERIPTEDVGVMFDDVVLLGGVNDIFFEGVCDNGNISVLQNRYQRVWAAHKALGRRVVQCTIHPCRDMSPPGPGPFIGAWTAAREVQRLAFNAYIMTKPTNVDFVIDGATNFDDGTGRFKNFGTWTYDGLHPTHGIAGNAGPGSDLIGTFFFLNGPPDWQTLT